VLAAPSPAMRRAEKRAALSRLGAAVLPAAPAPAMRRTVLRPALRCLGAVLVLAAPAPAMRRAEKRGRPTARRTAGAGAASTSAAPRRLKRAARRTAPRTVEASAVRRRAARRQSLECQAVCSARAACEQSATMRRRSSPQDTAWHPACARARRTGAAGGGPPGVDQLTAAAMPGLLCM
jgi:hypothetical protein